MTIKDMINGKKEWKLHQKRVKSLPDDYQFVYYEIQKYLFKVGPKELTEGIDLLSDIVDLFEDGVRNGHTVLEVTGKDVANFCDELIKDSDTYDHIISEYTKAEYEKAMKKEASKRK